MEGKDSGCIKILIRKMEVGMREKREKKEHEIRNDTGREKAG